MIAIVAAIGTMFVIGGIVRAVREYRRRNQ